MKVVVTRHEGLINLARERGLLTGEEPVIKGNATPDDVRGKDVFGILPLSLAAVARSVTELPLRLPLELRGKDLDAEQCREFVGEETEFVVFRKPKANELLGSFCRTLQQYHAALPEAALEEVWYEVTNHVLKLWRLPPCDFSACSREFESLGLSYDETAANGWLQIVIENIFRNKLGSEFGSVSIRSGVQRLTE